MKWAKSDQKLSKFMKLWTFINCLKWINYSYKQINCRMEWFWAHETQLDVLVGIFPWKTPHLATTATVTLKWQRAICDSLQLKQLVVISVNPDCRNIFFEFKERPATGENKPCPILHASFVYGAYWRKKLTCVFWYMTHWMFVKKVFLYFYNVLGENQYFPFETPPKSGFWCSFFNFSFYCIVGLSFLQLAIKQFKQFAPDIA